MLCCTPSDERAYPDREATTDTMVFEKPRPFNIQEIRRLASAISNDSCMIWVCFPEPPNGRPVICGLMKSQALPIQPPDIFLTPGKAAPHALLVRVDGPGRITVYQGEFPIASLRRGRIFKGGHMPTMDLSGAHRLFKQSLKILSAKIMRPKNASPLKWSEVEWLSIAATVKAIIRNIQARGHGGTLILVPVDCDISDKVIIKYPLVTGSNILAQRFVNYINVKHQLEDLECMAEGGGTSAPEEGELCLTEFRMKESLARLQETCAFVGDLSGTDGALVMRTDFSIDGFGAEIQTSSISGSMGSDISIYSEDKSTAPLDIQQYGMRHRSAIRLCAGVPGLVIFVISQDGEICIIYQDNGKILFKSGLRISTQNAKFTLPSR